MSKIYYKNRDDLIFDIGRIYSLGIKNSLRLVTLLEEIGLIIYEK